MVIKILKLKATLSSYEVENREYIVKKKRKTAETLLLIKYGVKIVDYMNLNPYRIRFYTWSSSIPLKVVYRKTLIISFVIFTGKHVNGLKTYQCSSDWWDHSAAIGKPPI